MNGLLSEIKYHEREKEFFNYLFNLNKSEASNYIEGIQFANLMRKTNLSKVNYIYYM